MFKFNPLTGNLDLVNASGTAGVFYNVKDYGAVGNGTTDDTASIQNTLNAAYGVGGGIVFLPAGVYTIDPNPGLQVKTNTSFMGTGNGSILKLKAGSTHNDNLVKSESWTNVTLRNFLVDGNRTNQSGTSGSYTYTQYGVYFGSTTDSLIQNVTVKSTTGVGIHIYNGTGVVVDSCQSTDNNYHGYEFEQDTGCHLTNSHGYSNRLYGLLLSPGEISGTGSKGNTISNNSFDSNTNYGIATNAANADISAYLSQGDMITSNKITGNSFYGVNFYKQNGHIFTNNYIAGNGYFGLYAFGSSNNTISDNIFFNNSQVGNGSYDEILLEGSTSSLTVANNIVSNNTILMSGTPKARYGISEASPGDGPNIIYGNNIPTSGTSGRLNIQNTSTLQFIDTQTDQLTIKGNKIFTTGLGIAANSVTPSSALGGIDAPFGSSTTRIYSTVGMQLVTANGPFDAYVSNGSTQNNTFSAYYDHISTHGYGIQDVLDPVNIQDAATKGYVDTRASAANFVDLTTNQTIAGTKTFSVAPTFTSGATMNATSIVTDTTTGLKIGTSTTQKIGFFNNAPIAKQGATIDLGVVLSNFGFRTGGTAYPITTSGTITFTGTTNLNNGAIIPLTQKLSIATGTNASAGTGTLAAGTVTISTNVVTASSLIFLTDTASTLTNVGTLSVSAKSAGTSFTVTSSNVLDTSTFSWLIIN